MYNKNDSDSDISSDSMLQDNNKENYTTLRKIKRPKKRTNSTTFEGNDHYKTNKESVNKNMK